MSDMKKLEGGSEISKRDMVGTNGVPITQSLFLEIGYSDHAIYTLKDWDYTYKGKLYPSIKRLYLECEDTTEYEFANKHFLGWNHWQRIANNTNVLPHVESWREELELKLRARAARSMIDLANTGSFQATKWMVDKGWEEKKAGRPSKAEREAETRKQKAFEDNFTEDYARLRIV